MYKIVYISPEMHAKLVVLKDLGLIKSISGFVDVAINQAIKGIEKKNTGENRKMKSKTKELNLEEVKKTNYDLYLELSLQEDYKKYTGMGYKPVYEDGEIMYWVRTV